MMFLLSAGILVSFFMGFCPCVSIILSGIPVRNNTVTVWRAYWQHVTFSLYAFMYTWSALPWWVHWKRLLHVRRPPQHVQTVSFDQPCMSGWIWNQLLDVLTIGICLISWMIAWVSRMWEIVLYIHCSNRPRYIVPVWYQLDPELSERIYYGDKSW